MHLIKVQLGQIEELKVEVEDETLQYEKAWKQEEDLQNTTKTIEDFRRKK